MRADVRLYRQWAEVKLDVLRARTGCGFQGKLRQLEDEQEKAIHNWFLKHSSRVEEFPVLREDLEALDSLVNSGAWASLQSLCVFVLDSASVSAAAACLFAHSRGPSPGF